MNDIEKLTDGTLSEKANEFDKAVKLIKILNTNEEEVVNKPNPYIAKLLISIACLAFFIIVPGLVFPHLKIMKTMWGEIFSGSVRVCIFLSAVEAVLCLVNALRFSKAKKILKNYY